MEDALTAEALLFAGLLAILLVGTITVFVLRTLNLPNCRRCGLEGVHLARSDRERNPIMRALFLYPHLCEKCLFHFYCFRSGKARITRDKNSAGGSSYPRH